MTSYGVRQMKFSAASPPSKIRILDRHKNLWYPVLKEVTEVT